MDFFNKKIEEGMAAQGGGEMSAERGVAIVQQHSRGWRRDRLRAFPELRFTYEEGESGVGNGWGGCCWGRAISSGMGQAAHDREKWNPAF